MKNFSGKIYGMIFIMGMFLIFTNLNINTKELSANQSVLDNTSHTDTDTAKINANRAMGNFDLPDDALEQAFMNAAGYPGPLGSMSITELVKVTGVYDSSGAVKTLDGLDYYISNGYLNTVSELSIDSSSISDLTPLEGWSTLTDLTIMNSNISDISTLSTMPLLRNINLSNNQISDISPLENLGDLEILLLDNNISNISSLGTRDRLIELSLESNNITDISALSNHINMRGLDINNNQVSDISALTNLSKFEEFHANNNLIEDVSPLANKPAMGLVEINNNKVYDLSPLSTVRGVLADNQNVEFNLGDFDDISKIPTEVSVFLKDGTEIKMPYGFDINDVVDYKDYSYTITFNQDTVGGEKFNGTIIVTFSYLAPIPLTPIGPATPIEPLVPIEPSNPITPPTPLEPATPVDNDSNSIDNTSKIDDKSDVTNDNHTLPELEETGFKITSFVLSITAIVISSITLLFTNKKED